MERIVLRHLSGSKVNQIEEFPLSHIKELIFGRDPSATVKYDPERDDLVGRQHARIAQDATDPTQFTITDLNSRNGTYLNKQRINGSTRITPGDLVQLGPGGPEVQFDLEPRPQNSIRPTRAVAVDSMSSTITANASHMPPTRSVNLESPSMQSAAVPLSSTGTVGKATVERMISQNIAITKRSEGRKYLLIGGAAFVAVLVMFAGVAGYLLYRTQSSESKLGVVQKDFTEAAANVPLNSTAIAKASRDSVVKIDVAWKLISPKGGLVYHQYGCSQYAINGPCYIELQDGTKEPLLTYDDRFSSTSKPIGGQFTSSGVVVSNDGFILTSHHVAAAWETPYDFPDEAFIGTLLQKDGTLRRIDIRQEPNFVWKPSETRQEIYTITVQAKKNTKIKEGEFTGRNDRLDVFFPGATERNNARQVKASESYDVAMIRVDLPGVLPKAELYDNLDAVKQGDTVFVLGYQLTSLPVYYYKKDSLSQTQKEIPEPTISSGNIGKLVRIQEASATKQGAFSKIGDAFQLSVNSKDTGYDGAPVFDDRGRVIGVFNVDKTLLDEPITVAVPIRYAIELMSVSRPSN